MQQLARRARSIIGVAASLLLVLATLVLEPLVLETGAQADNPRATRLVEQANEAVGKGDFAQAIIHLKNAVRADPDNLALREQLGLLELRTGDAASAEKELGLVVERAPERTTALIGLGDALLRQRKFTEVLRQIASGKRGDEAEAQVLALRGTAELALGRAAEALITLRAGVALKSTLSGQLALARGLAQTNDPVAAEQAVDAALAFAPESPDAMLLKAELRIAAGDPTAGGALLDRLLNLNDKMVEARLRRVALRLGRNDLDGAEADVEAAAVTAPKLPLTLFYRAFVAARKGDTAAAQQAVDQIPTDVVTANWRYGLLVASVNYASKRFDTAEAMARKVVAEAPDEAAPRRLLASMRLRAGAPDQALEVLLPALAKAPDDLTLVKMTAEAYLAAGKSSQAVELLQQASTRNPDDAQLARGLALGQARAGHADEALANLEAFSQRDPAERATFILLVSSYVQRGELDKAREAVARMRGADKDSPLPDYYGGVIALAARQIDEARTAFEAALKHDPKFVGARLALAQLARGVKDGAAEQAAYDAVLQDDPKNVPAMLGMAELERSREHPAESVRWLERAVTANPDAPEPRVRLINQLIATREPMRAVEAGENARKALPDNPTVIDALAGAYLANKQTEQAIGVYRGLASRYPGSAFPYLRMADAMAASGDQAATEQALRRAVETEPTSAPVARALVTFELANKRPDGALATAEALRTRTPTSAAGDLLVGDVLTAKQDFRGAAQAYAAAAEKAPEARVVALRIGALLRAGDLKTAEAETAAWMAKEPKDNAVGGILASHYLEAGNEARAVELYEQLLTRQPDDVVALNNLAWVTRKQKPQQALARAERAWSLAPTPDVGDTLGVILLEQGNAGRAVEILRTATQSAPAGQAPGIRLNLARALNAASKPDEARAILEDLTKADSAFKDKDEALKLLASLRSK